MRIDEALDPSAVRLIAFTAFIAGGVVARTPVFAKHGAGMCWETALLTAGPAASIIGRA